MWTVVSTTMLVLLIASHALSLPPDLDCTDTVTLIQITQLTPEEAAQLAALPCDTLVLNGIREMTPETALALTKFQGRVLMFNGLATLDWPDEELTLGLIKFRGQYQGEELHLDGLKSINKQQAIYLAHFCDQFSGLHDRCIEYGLGGYKRDPFGDPLERLRMLTRTTLTLNGLTELTPDQAIELVKSPVNNLELSGLADISPETAEALSRFKGCYLHLRAVKYLSDSASTALSNYVGYVYFDSLDSISLARWVEDRSVPSPDIIPEPYFPCYFGIGWCGDMIKVLTDSQAVWLAARSSVQPCRMSGLTTLTPSQARILASSENHTYESDGLDSISLEALDELVNSRWFMLSLNGLSDISLEQATILAEFGGREIHQYISLRFDTLDTNPPTIEFVLDPRRLPPGSYLQLNGVKSISDDVLVALLLYTGLQLELKGVEHWTDAQLDAIKKSGVFVSRSIGK